MLASSPFDNIAATARRAAEPDFRRFPSLWNTLSARKPGFLDNLAKRPAGTAELTGPMTSAEIEKFFDSQKPQQLYPFVWVRNALDPVPDSAGLHNWLHEVWVSYCADDMPSVNAPVRFAHGNLVHLDVAQLRFGKSTRFDSANVDLVRACCAYIHHRRADDQDDETEQAACCSPTA